MVLCTAIGSSAVKAGEVEDFRFARKLLSDGLFSAAGDEFMRFAKKYPNSTLTADAYFKAGEAYMQAGKADGALDAFERFTTLFPEDNRVCKAFYYRGKIFSALKRYSEAAKEFLNVPDKDITNPLVDGSLLEAGKALMAGGNFNEAARVLKRLIYERKRSELTPKALYIFSTVLENLGRSLEAKDILEDLMKGYPDSPVTAFALMKLAERAEGALDYDKAEEYYNLVLKRFKEKAIRERAASALIGVKKARNDLRGSIELASSFLRDFPDSKLAGSVASQAADEAFRLELYERVVDFVGTLRSKDISYPDSTGHYAIILAESYYRLGKVKDALGELERLEADPKISGDVRRAALTLKADIMAERGDYREAIRLYNTALLFDPSTGERISILERLADLCAGGAGDTLSAIHYLDMIGEIDPDGESGEDALWRASGLREKLGLLSDAEKGYRAIVDRFSFGGHYSAARKKLEALRAVPRVNVGPLRKLASIVSRSGADVRAFLEIGLVLLKDARDVEGAVPYLEKAYRSLSADSLKAKAGYHLALARYELSRITRDTKRSARLAEEASTVWREVARNSVGTRWGELSHRKYIEAKSPFWSTSERLSRYNEYLRYYGKGDGRWWALNGKLELFYREAADGIASYVDSAVAVCREVTEGRKVPVEFAREALLKLGYLFRMKGDHEGAARAMQEFMDRYPTEPRGRLLLYDLGEELMRLKDYIRAQASFERCIEAGPGGKLVEKCRLRIGDCLYYRRLFGRAKESYRDFLDAFPKSPMRDEVTFRLVLVSEMLGDADGALTLLRDLYHRDSLNRSLRIRVLKRYAKVLMEKDEHEKALNVLGELSRLKRDSESLTLLAEASLGAGRYSDALDNFNRALKLSGVDSCRALSGRILAFAGLGKFKYVDTSLEDFMSKCSNVSSASRVLLKLGIAEMEAGRIEQARGRFELLGKNFAGSEEADEAVYYSAVCDMKQGGYKDAIDKLEHFTKVAPDSPLIPNAYLKIASANYMLRNHNLAAKYYSFAVESARDPEIKYMALSNLGRVLQELEEWDKAADVWKDLAEQYPGKPDVVETLFNLGFCYGRAQKFELAYEVYSRIPDLTSDEEQEGRAHYWAGVALKNMNRLKDAAMEFLRVPYLRTGGMWGVTSKLEAASCYEKLGEYDEARKLCNEVISKYGRNSNWGKLAEKVIERIDEAEGSKDGNARPTGGGK